MEVQRKLASLDVILWLRENYKVGKNGSVSKNSVYQHYFDSCQEKGIEPVISATYFGKLVKRAFPGIKYNRKGPRGSAVQHYTCLKRAKIGVDGVAGASPYPEYGTPGGGAVIAGGAFTAEELALCQYSLKRERLEHADPDSPSLDHSPGTFSPRRRQAMFPHPFTPSTHGYPPPPSSSHRHHHPPPPPPHSHVPHYSHHHQHQHQHQHQHTQHFASEAPTHAYHRAPPSSHTRDAGGRSPTDDELSAPWTLEGDHSATPPPPPMSTMMRGSHAPPTVLAYQAQHRHQHAALAHARSRASPHPYDFEERHHQPHQPHHLSPDLGDHSHPYRHEYPAHHSSHYGHPAVHLRSPSLPLGYPVDRDHGHDHDHDHHHHHHHQQQQHPYYHHHQQLPQRGSAPLLPSPRGHASSSGANPHHPHTGHRFQAMLRGHASHTSAANSSPTSPSGSSHIGSSNPPSPPSPPPHLLLPSLDSAAFATPLLPSATTISSNSSASTAVATTSSGASVGGLRNAPPATDGHHHYQQQEQHNNRHNAADVVAAASTAPSTDETSHDRQQRHQAPAATSASSPELAIGAGPASSVPNAFEPSMEDMYPLPTFAGEDLERHQAQPPQHSHHQQQHHQPLRPPLGRSSSPALEHLLRGIASRDVEDEELVSFYDHYLKA